MFNLPRLAAIAAALLTWVPADTPAFAQDDAAQSATAVEYFEKEVRPILVQHCYNCHSADTKPAGGLRVDDRNGLLVGGGRGPAVVPGDPDASLLVQAVSHTDSKLTMPPDSPRLSDEQIAVFRQWIADGATWPAIEIPDDLIATHPDADRARRSYWAFQPLAASDPPAVQDSVWPRSAVDHYVLARLEANGLEPVADADRVALLRRVTFALTGLPPTPAEVEAFIADRADDAFARVVDRLLESPAFGEHWGRHWLDVARYGESTGSSRNVPYPHAWRYRDYVIDAFNSDKPYDEFLREQIAGDLLPAADEGERREHLIATGFLALGVKDVNQRFPVRFEMDNIDEQIDTVSRAVLALTVSCARCHDHKFDPISQHDYYALAGIFKSTDLCAGVRSKMGGGGLDYYDTSRLLILSERSEPDPDLADKIATAEQAVAAAQSEFERLRDSPEGDELAPNGKPKRQRARQQLNRRRAELNALSDPSSTSDVALGVRDSRTIGDTELRVRGEAEQLGPVVPRGFPVVLSFEGQSDIPAESSGRLELADWLTSPQNPLTSRVIVNRVWHHLFGAGLVTTVDNFGITGDSPSHPELLDYLATQFIADGWSVKQLVRSLVLTRTYQLGSEATSEHLAADPANRWLWRYGPRRLTAEEIRDAMLASADALDLSRPAVPPVSQMKVVELRNNGPEAQQLILQARNSRHRSIYLPLLRTLVPASLEVFDFAEQGMVTGSRESTTVPSQALFLLNDAFVRRQSLSLADRLLADAGLDDPQRINLAYLTVLGRDASASEIDRALAFATDYELAVQSGWTNPAVAVAVVNDAGDAPATDAAVNPDDVEQSDAPLPEETVQPASPRAAAWSAFVQALLASGEFRYVR